MVAQPHRLVGLSVGFHDARGLSASSIETPDVMRDRFDLAHAWIELGTHEGPGWLVRAGRQELSIGDERLIGGDAEWSLLGLGFDALRAELRSSSASLNVFTAAPVDVEDRRWNRYSRSQRLHGAYASFTVGKLLVDPYALRSTDDSETSVRHTAGVHLHGDLRGGYDHNFELALQRGRIAGVPIRAWMAHLEAGRTIASLRLAAEYNYASGDSDAVGTNGSFCDLFAAAYNKYGIADPFSATNIQNVEFSGDWDAGARLKVSTGYRSYWLVTSADSLYPSVGDAVTHVSGLHVADQVNLSAVYRHTPKWRFAVGYGRFVRRDAALPATSAFLSIGRSF